MTGLRIRHLEADFLKFTGEQNFQRTQVMAGADGIILCCPKCFLANNNSAIGTHSIICWAPHVPENWRPGPGRWRLEGTSIDDVSLVASSSSVRLTSGCEAHFFVRSGQIEMV